MRILMTKEGEEVPLLSYGPQDAAATLLLAHGAGAPMDSGFMSDFARGIADAGHACIRFEFPYMARRRQDGRRRPPDRQPKLTALFGGIVEALRAEMPSGSKLFAGGKSMGGRMASILAAEEGPGRTLDGIIVAGYPFHPPGKPDRLRTDHFSSIQVPVLICQGERDPFGTRAEVEDMPLPASFKMVWLADGDHDLRPRRASGRTHAENLDAAVAAAARFMNG